jgi:hypothetical protein
MAGEDALDPPRTRVDEPRWRGVEPACRANRALSGERNEDLVALADAVVQQLLAVGLATRSLLDRITDPELDALAQPIVDGLDAAIDEVRTTVFDLQTRERHGRP